MPPKKRETPPGGSGASSKIIAAVKRDGSETTTDLLVSQLVPRDVRPDEIPELRAMWWRQAALGHRLPAEAEIIVIEGART